MTTQEFLDTKRQTGRTTKMITHMIIQMLFKQGQQYCIHVMNYPQMSLVMGQVRALLKAEDIPYASDKVSMVIRVGQWGNIGTIHVSCPAQPVDKHAGMDCIHIADHCLTEAAVKKHLAELARWE